MDRAEYIRTHTKPMPEKYCAYCGARLVRKRFKSKQEDLSAFKRRKYCDRECMKRAFVIKGENTQQWGPAHGSAKKIAYMIEGKEKRCEKCGSTQNIDVHHVDGNHNNNRSENLMVLCRSCHMKEHREIAYCKVCGKPARRYGYCNKHAIRYKRYGDPLLVHGKPVVDDSRERPRPSKDVLDMIRRQREETPILQYGKDGVFLAEYPSIVSACETCDSLKPRYIQECCEKSRETSYGFIWRYKDTPLTTEEFGYMLAKRVESKAHRREIMRAKLGKEVKQYDADGNLLNTFLSSRSASETVGVPYFLIDKACRGICSSAGGYKWTY